jgi:ubiquinone/menaquinone biosynthesis C-methylase UbiE
MPDLFAIFHSQAQKYDLLVSREDYESNLLPAVERITAVRNKRIIEFGAGTGRLTRLLAPLAASIDAFDSSEAMLVVASAGFSRLGFENCRFSVADHRHVPAPDGKGDLAISAWSIGCLIAVAGVNWKKEIESVLKEMKRVLNKDGVIVIIETLGTGSDSPHPPEGLKAYYGELEDKGFQSHWIRTDYQFRDMDEARDLTEFFFGSEPIHSFIKTDKGIILPECTGIWWKSAVNRE